MKLQVHTVTKIGLPGEPGLFLQLRTKLTAMFIKIPSGSMIEALGGQYSSQKFGYARNTEFDFLRQQAGSSLHLSYVRG